MMWGIRGHRDQQYASGKGIPLDKQFMNIGVEDGQTYTENTNYAAGGSFP